MKELKFIYLLLGVFGLFVAFYVCGCLSVHLKGGKVNPNKKFYAEKIGNDRLVISGYPPGFLNDSPCFIVSGQIVDFEWKSDRDLVVNVTKGSSVLSNHSADIGFNISVKIVRE